VLPANTNATQVFLTPFGSARLLAPDKSRLPNPDCPVCGVFNTSIQVDLSRVTLKDVVDVFIKEKLGFEDREFVLNNEVGILYDADETENLTKKLSDLGKLFCAMVSLVRV
jgi:ubiquitin-like 1-activating enzyme E1 B